MKWFKLFVCCFVVLVMFAAVNCYAGAFNTIAIDGEKGDKGDPGIDGQSGDNGINGIDGLSGVDGRDGVNGLNGQNGFNGLNGKDAESIDSDIEKTGIMMGFSLRILDTKRFSVNLFDTYNIRREKNDAVGVNVMFKLGTSYEERKIEEAELRIAKGELRIADGERRIAEMEKLLVEIKHIAHEPTKTHPYFHR